MDPVAEPLNLSESRFTPFGSLVLVTTRHVPLSAPPEERLGVQCRNCDWGAARTDLSKTGSVLDLFGTEARAHIAACPRSGRTSSFNAFPSGNIY